MLVGYKTTEGVYTMEIILQNDEVKLSDKAILVDGFCSGNQFEDKGMGGFVVMLKDEDKKEIISRGTGKGYSNNYWELYALYQGVLFAKLRDIEDIYTDSKVVLYWLVNGKCKKGTLQKEEIDKMIQEIIVNGMGKKIKFWKTDVWGDIPADAKNGDNWS